MKTIKILLFLAAAAFSVGWLSAQSVQTVTVTINPVPTGKVKPSAVVLKVNPNPAIVGQPLTFTAIVEGYPGGPTPSGKVQFLLNGVVGQTSTLMDGGITCTAPAPKTGKFTVSLKYLGDGNYLPK